MTASGESTAKPDSQWLRRIRRIEQFEDSWQESGTPDIHSFLDGFEPQERTALLHELIKIDLEYRWKRGDRRRIEQYAADFPELGAAGALPPDLVAEELQVREHYEPSQGAATWPASFAAQPAGPAASGDTVLERCSPGGRRLGRYELRERVGRGGFATVYRAWDPNLRREVAIKVPHAEYVSDAGLAARLRREATSAARLRHPAIVPIHEVAQDGETTFIVYQFIAGPTLAELLTTTRPAPQQAAEWVARLAEALDYAHQCGIVHRDVKPTNVMMGEDNQPTLADFGLALETGAAVPTLTQHGDILGTPAYMSPEQAAGRGHQADARTDVYGLGVVLYELLAGQVPFPGQSASVLHRVIHVEPPPPRRLRPTVPHDLETICLKAMAKEPHRRYASAGALADDLRRYLRHEPIWARRVGPAGRLLRWCRRQPALAATILGSLVALSAVVLFSFNRVVGERDLARAHLYRALIDAARAESQGRDTGWWWKAMDNLAQAARLDVADRDVPLLRDRVVQCVGTEFPCMRLERQWPAHDGPVTCVAYSPDGELVASGSRDLSLAVWHVSSRQELARWTGHGDRVSSVAFHPSGLRVASGSWDGSVRLWDLHTALGERSLSSPGIALESSVVAGSETSAAQQHVQFGAGFVHAVAFSRDGRWLAAGCEDGSIRVLAVGDTGLIPRAEPMLAHTAPVRSLAFSSDDRWLISGSEDRTVRFWNVQHGTASRTWTTINPVNTLAAARAGSMIACGQQLAFGMFVRHIESGYQSGSQQIHTAVITQVGWVGETHILAASADGTLKLWHPVGQNMREMAVARGSFGAVLSAATRSDGRRAAAGYRDGYLRLWEVAEPAARILLRDMTQNARFAGTTRRLIAGHKAYDLSSGLNDQPHHFLPRIEAMATHPDGIRFAYARDGGELNIADARDGRQIQRWQGSRAAIAALASSPDGRWLASAGDDGTVRIWEWTSGQLEQSIELQAGPIDHVQWSRDGRRLAARTSAAALVWDQTDPASARRLQLPGLELTAMALDNERVATGTGDGNIHLWSAATGEMLQKLTGHQAVVRGLAFGPTGETIASVSEDNTVRLWDVASASGQVVLSPVGATRVAFDPAGRYLCIGRTGSESTLISLETHRKLRAAESIDDHAVFAHDGSFLLAASNNGGVRRHDIQDVDARHDAHAEFVSWREIVPGGHHNLRSGVWGVATSLDGRWFATGGHDQVVKIWDAHTLQLVHSLEGHSSIVWGLGFSRDSKWLASGSSSDTGGEVIVWEVATGRRVRTLHGHARLVTSVAFDPAGQRLISASSDGSVLAWELGNLSADDLAPTTPGIVHDFDQPVHDVAFSPDGRLLAAACEDHRVAVWTGAAIEAATRTEPPDRPEGHMEFLIGHATPVWSVTFSPDGRYLASGADEGAIILWDAGTLKRVTTLEAGTRQIRSLSFSHDGGLLAGAAYTAPTVVWDLTKLRAILSNMGLDWRDPNPEQRPSM